MSNPVPEDNADIVVVGGGAAGCVLAARLAENGLTVLVLEAGGDPLEEEPRPGERSLPVDTSVPAFHTFASEHPSLKPDVWVQHYGDRARGRRDWRYDEDHQGILYPRAHALGGCAAHNAMIIIRPNDRDWNHIADLNGDSSWRATAMQAYWRRIERCRYRLFLWRWLEKLTGWNPTGHGWSGWMQTERSFPLGAVRDNAVRKTLLRSISAAADAYPGLATDWDETSNLDPNANRLWKPHASGSRIPPMGTKRHVRHGPRERLLDVRKRFPENVDLRLKARALTIEVGEDGRANAVSYRQNGSIRRAVAAKEIILAGGTFATPHLMLLSGLGDPEALEEAGIPTRAALPGVGRNLQDRYEVGVVSRMKEEWKVLERATYSTLDRAYRKWKRWRRGMYTSNGVVYSVELKSRPTLPVPDLFCFALLADFRGYYPGYSERVKAKDYLSWVVLKAYTSNKAGRVTLKSADPDVPPDITFNYFDEGSPGWEEDLDAVVTGVRFVRKVGDALGDTVALEEEPGRHRVSDDSLKDYVKNNAWGHHACGTCAMKPLEDGGVVDSRFRVHGVQGLRVADASIFPRIPGYFLVSAVYMIAEKAADAVLEDWT